MCCPHTGLSHRCGLVPPCFIGLKMYFYTSKLISTHKESNRSSLYRRRKLNCPDRQSSYYTFYHAFAIFGAETKSTAMKKIGQHARVTPTFHPRVLNELWMNRYQCTNIHLEQILYLFVIYNRDCSCYLMMKWFLQVKGKYLHVNFAVGRKVPVMMQLSITN